MQVFNKEFGYGHVVRASVKNEKYDIRSHIHQFSEIIFVFDGNVDLVVDGKKYALTCGDLAVITPFQIHEVHSVGIASFWMCVFSNDVVPNHTLEPDLFYERTSSVFRPAELLKRQIDELISKVVHPIRINGEAAPRIIRSTLYSIFCEYTDSIDAVTGRKKKNVLAEVFLYMNEHYLENISVRSVGKALGYNPKYLSQCINSIPQLSFSTLLNSLRIDKAKNMLLSTNFTATEIAFECGFENEQSFYRTFGRIVGTTPRKYRMGLK